MTDILNTQVTGFGHLLRFWRNKRKLSQLDLAGMAETTTRHLSFIETGRSRPGRDLILRIVRAMNLGTRDVNSLMTAAGFSAEYAELDFDSDQIGPYRAVIKTMLERHNPYPGVVVDRVGAALMANNGYMAFSPDGLSKSREDAIDQMFDPNGNSPSFIENWQEIVWSWLDYQKADLAMSHNPKLAELVQRAEAHLKGMKRPDNPAQLKSGLLTPRFNFGDQTISTFATLMRFENVTEVTLSEIRLQLIFPADDISKEFFENLYKNYKAIA